MYKKILYGTLLLVLAILISLGVYWALYPQQSQEYLRRLRTWIHSLTHPRKPPRTYRSFGVMLPSYDIHGIDVSGYQGDIDWEAVRQMRVHGDSISFAFIKATEGTRHRDRKFATNWANARRVGLLCGAYHYFNPALSGKQQAEWFLNTVQLAKGDLPPVLDIEELSQDRSLESLRAELKIFLQTLEQTYRVKPIIYSSRNFFEAHLGSEFSAYPLWVAQYENLRPPRLSSHRWSFWQHTAKARVNGIDTPVDLNVFQGNKDDLHALRAR